MRQKSETFDYAKMKGFYLIHNIFSFNRQMPKQEKALSKSNIINLLLFAKTIEKWTKDMNRIGNANG